MTPNAMPPRGAGSKHAMSREVTADIIGEDVCAAALGAGSAQPGCSTTTTGTSASSAGRKRGES